jgi:hypothetical protein
MKFWATLTYVFGFGSVTHWGDDTSAQSRITISSIESIDTSNLADIAGDTPVFTPPNGRRGSSFTCRYPTLKGWKACSTPQDRGCWLKGPNGERYDINSNYETKTPPGIVRKVRPQIHVLLVTGLKRTQYELDVTDMTLAPDGFKNLDGKVFNKKFPGPWIREF